MLTVLSDAVNVRKGPGTDYEVVGVALRDAQYPLSGRNEQGDWWRACCFAGESGWLYAPLVSTQNAESIAVITDIAPPVIPETAAPVALAPTIEDAVGEELPPSIEQEMQPETPSAEEPKPPAAQPVQDTGTAGNFDPNAQYQIVHYRVLGFEDNNGGIFNKGGQQLIFLTVLDENGAPLDGAVVKDAVGDKLNVVTGGKGPGMAEIKMDWDPYKLYVAADPSGAVTSQVSNQMNNPYPHIPDVVGMLGPPDNEYAICPTPDDRCTPPFYHAHWSYEITFRKVR